MSNKKVGIISVLYKQDYIHIETNSNDVLIVIDNTPNQDLKIISDKIIYLPLKENLGIAEAQNRGIEIALNNKCTHVIFLDQDSIIPINYFKKMVDEYDRISRLIPNLFLLGPTVFNEREGREYKSTIHSNNVTEFNFCPRREIISSGSCVSAEKINRVGFLDKELFIDYVDFDWCWRGNAMGLQSGITPSITIKHFVGEQEYRFLKQLIIISSPIRYFYQTRNYLWLLRRKYVPSSWKVNSGIKRLIFSATYLFKVKEWKDIYRYSWKGFIAGIIPRKKKIRSGNPI